MSTILIEKSRTNEEAASLLHYEELFCSSVHCSYYSSFQLMLHILYEVLDEEEEEYSAREEVNDRGSHNYLFNTIRREIISSDGSRVRDFGFYMRKLKELRKIADYKQIKVLKQDSSNAKEYSNKFNIILNDIFAI